MSKNKHNKELERLRKLYGNAPTVSEPQIPQSAVTHENTPTSRAVVVHEHEYVRKDLIQFTIVAVICFILLIVLNFLAASSGFGQALFNLFSRLV